MRYTIKSRADLLIVFVRIVIIYTNKDKKRDLENVTTIVQFFSNVGFF